jgi:hypothetical protein
MSLSNASGSEVVVTGVDALIDLLKKIPQIDVPEAAKKLKYPIETVQSWVDFLVEEKIIGIEYNLTTPRIYLILDQKSKKVQIDLGKEFGNYKHDFQNNLQRKNKIGSKNEFEWKNHISVKLEFMKQFFFSEAEKRELKEPAKLWEEYKQKTIIK